MCTTYLPLHMLQPLDVSTGGPQVNKFEQVSSDGHQISLAGDCMSDGGIVQWGLMQHG